MRYKVHRLDINMKQDQQKLEGFLNNLKGEVVAIIPNVKWWIYWIHKIDFLYVVEKREDQ